MNLGKYSLITHNNENVMYLSLNKADNTIDAFHINFNMKIYGLREFDIEHIIFDTNLLKTNKYFIINGIFIVYIPDDTYYDAKNKKIHTKYCFNLNNEAIITNNSIDFNTINSIEIASVKAKYLLIKRCLDKDSVIKYNGKYYTYINSKLCSKLFKPNSTIKYYCIDIQTRKKVSFSFMGDIEMIFDDIEKNKNNIIISDYDKPYNEYFIPQKGKYYKIAYITDSGLRCITTISTTHANPICFDSNTKEWYFCGEHYGAKNINNIAPSFCIPLKSITHIREVNL